MKRAVLVVLLALVGCGGGGGGTPVDGSWIVTVGQCAEGITFTDGNYARLLLCPDTTGAAFNLEEERGTYVVRGDLIVYTAGQTTCPGMTAKIYNTPFMMSGASLVLTYTDGVVIFARNLSSGGNAVTTFGCFNAGVFTPGPLVSL